MDVVTAPAPPPLPAACADCLETTLLAQIGAIPTQLAIQQFRSLEGKIRINFGTTSMITNPLTQVRIILDHIALEARILLSGPAMPAIPPLPSASIGLAAELALQSEILKIEQLGIAFIEGHEALGMRYLFPPGGLIFSWEIWTSTTLHLPVLTRTIGTFGERLCACKCTPVPPPPSMFEIPPGYKVIQPPSVKVVISR
jgi:hypothetical protein